jgi:hypothetical protein
VLHLCPGSCFRAQHYDMKTYIREILNDLKKPEPTVPTDLDNQILSDDPAERVRQLDQQAQENEERESSS